MLRKRVERFKELRRDTTQCLSRKRPHCHVSDALGNHQQNRTTSTFSKRSPIAQLPNYSLEYLQLPEIALAQLVSSRSRLCGQHTPAMPGNVTSHSRALIDTMASRITRSCGYKRLFQAIFSPLLILVCLRLQYPALCERFL
jgi:hypothetical protein